MIDKDFAKHIEEVTQKVKKLHVKLPEVSSEELEQLRKDISSINLDKISNEQAQFLKPAFDELISEVNETMKQIETLGRGILKDIESVESQKRAVKAYTKAQN